MTDKNSNDSRRKLLKSVAVGGGAAVTGKALPESWSKPVVDAVMLPAHAATPETDKLPPEATTTQCPDCCDQYCYYFETEGIFMSLAVDGECISAVVYINQIQSKGKGSTTASCGAFTITIPVPTPAGGDLELVVGGDVALDCSEVSGTLKVTSNVTLNYKATTGNCRD